ncbi:MAG: translocation/assembly module TamB domain-containing protein, partial [Myxococcota bacterium]
GEIAISDAVVAIADPAGSTVVQDLDLALGVEISGSSVSISGLDLDVDLDEPLDIDVGLDLALQLANQDVRIDQTTLSVDGLAIALEGVVEQAETNPVLDLKLSSEALDSATINKLAEDNVLHSGVSLGLILQGPLSDLTTGLTFGIPSQDQEMRIDVKTDLSADVMPWSVVIHTDGYDVHAMTPLAPEPTVLNGRYAVEGVGIEYPEGMEASINLVGASQIFAGEAVESMALLADLKDGILEIQSLDAVHSVATVHVAGQAHLIESTAKLDVSALVKDASRLAKYGVEDLGGSFSFDGDVQAGWEPEVAAVVDGSIRLDHFRGPGITIRRGTGSIHGEMKGDVASGNGQLSLQHLDASGTVVDGVHLQFDGGQDASGNVAVEADLNIDKVAMPDDQFEMEGLGGTLSASIPTAGDMVANADLMVKTFKVGASGYRVDGGPLSFEMVGDQVDLNIDLQREQTPFLVGAISGDLETGQWDIGGFKFALLKNDGLDATQNIRFRLVDGGATDVDIDLANPGGKGRLRIVGQATAEDPNLHIQAENIDLEYISHMLDEILAAGKPLTPTTVAAAAAVDGQSQLVVEDSQPTTPSDKPSTPEEPVAATATENPLAGVSGSASMDIRITGDKGIVGMTGWMNLVQLSMKDQVNQLDIRADVGLTDSEGEFTLRVGDEKDTFLWTKGRIPINQEDGEFAINCDGELRLRTMVPGLKFGTLAKRIPAIGTEVRGRASLDLAVRGGACDPDLSMVGAMDTAVGAQGERVRLDLSMDREQDDLVMITTVEQESRRIARIGLDLGTKLSDVLNRMMRLGEEVDLSSPNAWLNDFDVKLAIQGAEVERLVRMGEVTHPLRGVLGGGVRVSGTMESPQVEGGLVMVDGQIGDALLEQFTVGFVPYETGYSLDTIMNFQGDGGLVVDGYLPLSIRFDEEMSLEEEGLSIRIEGDGIPLAMAAGPDGVADAKGTITVDGLIGGTLAEPVPKVSIGSKDAGFTLLATALRYDPINMRIDYEPGFVTINEFSMRSAQLWGQNPKSGTFGIKGKVGLGDDGPTNVQLQTVLDGFWLSSTRQASVATSGIVSVSGQYPNLSVVGGIVMDEANIAVGEEVLKEASGFEVDESITIHRTKREVVVVEREEEEPSVTDNFDINLDIDLGQAVRLKADVPLAEDFGAQFAQLANFALDLGLDGQLKVEQEDAVLSVMGELQTLRGEAIALGKRFSLNEGSITFTGTAYTNPQLDIKASHQVGQYGTVDIAIAGDVESTSMELSSPEYPDQTDVMSMLLFGKPASAMSETEGESGAGLLSAAMASVGGQAARATGASFLQNVQIDPGSGSVKVGFPLTDRIYLSIEKMNPDNETDNITQAALEWILTRSSYGELVTGDRGQSSGDVYWRWRF